MAFFVPPSNPPMNSPMQSANFAPQLAAQTPMYPTAPEFYAPQPLAAYPPSMYAPSAPLYPQMQAAQPRMRRVLKYTCRTCRGDGCKKCQNRGIWYEDAEEEPVRRTRGGKKSDKKGKKKSEPLDDDYFY
eukprot:NODE_6495_length_564_cov_28.846602_g6080_i0.p1 GENE.NODE_6495_length_564_cov_28.846602_g6080_i0~~NODE_6495_length_564_cov_28.846602_g6080_i0.p1  ORF type:complete len:147 (+),score=31.73 NODE_6495_length_564_cov_28.846602_g6080_i0:54-443(+)